MVKIFFQGQKDYPLIPRGIKQVRRLIVRWQADGTRIDQVIASPLQRAADTAEMICKAFKGPLEVDPDWRERDVGRLTGIKRNEEDPRSYPDRISSRLMTGWVRRVRATGRYICEPAKPSTGSFKNLLRGMSLCPMAGFLTRPCMLFMG